MIIVDWKTNREVLNAMKMSIFDMVYDEIKSKSSLDI